MENRVFFVEFNNNLLIKLFQNLLLVIYLPLYLPSFLLMFIKRKNKIILTDVGTYLNLIKSIVFLKHYRNLFYHRIGRISLLISWILPGEKSIIIPYKTVIGKNAHFIHNISSHLNAESIGDNFVCYQHVVIGAKSLNDKKLPKIGNNVILATGVVVVGGIEIGNNVKVSANALIYNDIPSNCIVAGNPAIIYKKDIVI